MSSWSSTLSSYWQTETQYATDQSYDFDQLLVDVSRIKQITKPYTTSSTQKIQNTAQTIIKVLSLAATVLAKHELDKRLLGNCDDYLTKMRDCLAVHEFNRVHQVAQELNSFLLQHRLDSPYDTINNFVTLGWANNGKICGSECIFEENFGEIYLSSVRYFSDPEEDFTLEGYPSQAKTQFDFLEQINEFQGEKEVLPNYFISDFLSSPAMNIPSDVIVDHRSYYVRLRSQVVADLPRMPLILLNGNWIYSLHKRNREMTNDELATFIFTRLLNEFDDAAMTDNLCKLITQGSVSRVWEMIVRKFQNVELQYIPTQALEMLVRIQSRQKKNCTVPVKIEYSVVFGLKDFHEEPYPVIRYITATRVVTIDRSCLKAGKGENIELYETTSRWFHTRQEAITNMYASH